jgi:ABC-type sugar transport system ATPase subunit
MIEIRHLSKTIQGNSVLQDITLNVENNSILALIGPSGCGKTTLLRLIAGLDAPDKGNIAIDGIQVSDSHHVRPPHRRRLGMIFQDLALWPHMTARQHLEYVIRQQNRLNGNDVASVTDHQLANGFKITKDGKTTKKKMMNFSSPLRALRGGKKDCKDKVNQLLSAVNLNDHSDRYPHQLSGGEQQRLAIIRVLAQEPAYLLMDEPFSNLDPILKSNLETFIGRIQAEYGIGIVYVTHNFKDMETITDQVAVMQDGQLVQVDDKSTVFQRPANRFVEKMLGR